MEFGVVLLIGLAIYMIKKNKLRHRDGAQKQDYWSVADCADMRREFPGP
jgi:hypothetical protein